MSKGPKILVFDIETSPIVAHVWGLRDENVGLEQIKEDWHLLAWAAKWVGEREVIYMDQRNENNIANDRRLVREIRKLLDKADFVVTQNGQNFDVKKVNARMVIHGMKPPSSYRQIDTLQIARHKFGFTSNKLAYMTEKLNKKYKKLDHKKFPGFELWKECLKGNMEAWKEMEKYNKHDVLATEELYQILLPWEPTYDASLFYEDYKKHCMCGSTNWERRGFAFTASGKFQRFRCRHCGAWVRSMKNLFGREKRETLRFRKTVS